MPERNLIQNIAEKHYTWKYLSPLGHMTMASDGRYITGLWFDNQKHYASTLSEHTEERYIPVFKDTEQWLDLYFSGCRPDFTPPLRLIGSEYRTAVWKAIESIPYGQITTYKTIADNMNQIKTAKKTSPRAVGGAIAHNPISIIIPCHRVIGSNGSMTGYAGGTEIKKQLLKLENIQHR